MFESRIPDKCLPACAIYDDMEKHRMFDCIERGDTLKKMSSIFNTSQTNVRYWLKKFDLKLKRGARGKKSKDFQFPRKCSCGETNPNKFYGNKTTVCAKCHRKNTHTKGKENRLYIIEKLKNKCFNCGFDKWRSSLDVHHLDPSQKDVSFSTIRYWTRDRIDKEIAKCVLLCRNCHAAHHSGELVNNKLSVV